MTRIDEIESLRAKRNYYQKLGKRKAVMLIEARLRSLLMRQFNDEAMRQQMDADFYAIAAGDFDLASQVYGEP